MKKILLFLYLFPTVLFSQQRIKELFVSNITVTHSDSKILLKWKNPDDLFKEINIYRSNAIINSIDSLKNATKIATLKNKENSYIDIPDDYGEYYYAILIKNKEGIENLIFIPFRNYTLNPIVIEKKEKYEIIKFSAKSNNKNIILEWDYKSDLNEKSDVMVMIYRNITPITNEEILTNSIKIAQINIKDKTYIDYPIANINYYYAIFIQDEEQKRFIPDVNITINPLSIKGSSEIFFDFSIDSFIPLPILSFFNDPATGKNFKDPQILKIPQLIKYNQKIKDIISNDKNKFYDILKESNIKNNTIPLDFNMLKDEELFEAKNYKIEYNRALLFIRNKDYDNALNTLEEILIENPLDYLKVRISYYIATIYYIKGDYYKAYIYYIFSYNDFHKEIEPYLESISNIIFKKLER